MSTLLNAASIEGKYEILERMAEGGMGAVYKVRHLVLEEIRVIKVTKAKFQDNPELKERFLREARLAVKMKHQNIAQVYDCTIEKDGTAYLVMEYIHGVHLDELVEQFGLPDMGLALDIADQSLAALHYLHLKDIVHRDISPDNLMLTEDEQGNPLIKMIDLGIAKAMESDQSLTEAGSFLGKIAYASPEHFSAAAEKIKIDARCDVYSFGVVFYKLLTGKHPIQGDDFKSLLMGHLMHPPIPFADSDPEGKVPLGLQKVILRSLEKDRKHRFSSAEEFRQAIVTASSDVGDEPTQQFDLSKSLQSLDLRKVGKAKVRPGSTQNRLDNIFPSGPTPPPGPPDVAIPEGPKQTSDASGTPDWQREITSLLNRAEDLVRMDRADLARAPLDAALRIQPTDKRGLSILERVVALQTGAPAETPQPLDATQVVDIKEHRDEPEERPGIAEAAELAGQARELLTAGDYEGAIAKLERATELDPDNGEISGELSAAIQFRQQHEEELEYQRQLDEATEEVDQLITADKLDEATNRLGQAIQSFGEIEVLNSLQQRITELEKQRRDQQVSALVVESRELLAGGQHDDAIAKLGEARELDPANTEVEEQLGAAREAQQQHQGEQERQRQIDNATQEVERLITADKLDKATKRLGQAFDSFGEIEALQRLRQRISELEDQRRDQQISALVAESRELLAAGKHDAAIAKLEQAQKLDPASSEVESQLQAAREARQQHQGELERQQQIAKAANEVERFIKANKAGDAADRLGQAIDAFGETKSLRKLQRRVSELQTKQLNKLITTLVAESRKLLADDKHDAAIAKLEEALEASPDNRAVEDELSAAREKLRQYEEETAKPAVVDVPAEEPQKQTDLSADVTAPVPVQKEAATPAPAKQEPTKPLPAVREAAVAPEPTKPKPAPRRKPVVSKGRKPQAKKFPTMLAVAAAAVVVVIIGAVLLFRSLGGPDSDVDPTASSGTTAAVATVSTGGLAINALPWGEVIEVVDEEGVTQELPADHHTPMYLGLPAGSYKVSLRSPNGGPPVQVDAVIGGDETTRIVHRFRVMDVDEFLNSHGFLK